jgi:hypothetical protein
VVYGGPLESSTTGVWRTCSSTLEVPVVYGGPVVEDSRGRSILREWLLQDTNSALSRVCLSRHHLRLPLCQHGVREKERDKRREERKRERRTSSSFRSRRAGRAGRAGQTLQTHQSAWPHTHTHTHTHTHSHSQSAWRSIQPADSTVQTRHMCCALVHTTAPHTHARKHARTQTQSAH